MQENCLEREEHIRQILVPRVLPDAAALTSASSFAFKVQLKYGREAFSGLCVTLQMK